MKLSTQDLIEIHSDISMLALLIRLPSKERNVILNALDGKRVEDREAFLKTYLDELVEADRHDNT